MKNVNQIDEVAPILAVAGRAALAAGKPLLKAGAKKLFNMAARKGIKTIGKKGTRAVLNAGKEIAKSKVARDGAKKAIKWGKDKLAKKKAPITPNANTVEEQNQKQLVESWSNIVDKALNR